MTRLLLLGLIVVGLAIGVSVNADTPADNGKPTSEQMYRRGIQAEYLGEANAAAKVWSFERLREERDRLQSERLQSKEVLTAKEVAALLKLKSREAAPSQDDQNPVPRADEDRDKAGHSQRHSPHDLRGTYLITGEGEHNMVVMIDPTVVEIGSRTFLYGKVGDDNEVLRVSEHFAGEDAYMPLDGIQSIQQVRN